MKVRFKITRTVKDGTGTTFEKGKVYDLPEGSAKRWIGRGIAELAGPASKTSKPAVVETLTMGVPERTVHPIAGARQAPVTSTSGPTVEEVDATSLHTDPDVTPPITSKSP